MTTIAKLFSESELPTDQLKVKRLTGLYLSSGKVVACDPLVYQNPEPFTQTVEPGTYPVFIYLLTENERVAYAELRISEDQVECWEIAVTKDQDPATLGADEIFGYPVDAGLGCFMDADTVQLLDEHDRELQQQKGRNYISYYDDYVSGILEDPKAESNDYCTLQPYPDKANNVAIFQSGYGDGFYATYVGLDTAGKAIKFITEFIDIA